MATYALTIAGAAKQLQAQSLQIRETANGRNTFSFDVVSTDGTYRPALNAEVILTEDAVRIAAGHISQPAEAGVGSVPGTPIVTRVQCVDFNALADRAFTPVSLVIPAGTLKAALQALDDYLTDYGVTLDAGQVDGPSLPELTFENAKISDALTQLSALTDYAYVWEIDYTKTLRMFALGSSAAPFDVLSASNRNAFGDVTVEPSRNDYANYIILLAGTGTREVTEALTFDGIEDTFVLTYTLYSHRGYVTNGAANEGLGFPDTWEYDAATNSITRTAGAPAAGSGSITFTAQFPLRVVADSGVAAADRVTKIVTYPDVFDATVAQALADAELVRAQLTVRTIKYRTLQPNGIHPGQTQTITVPPRNVNGTCLVQAVTVTNPTGNHLVRDVTAVEGTTLPGDWRDTVRQWGMGGGASSVASVSGIVSSGGVGGTGTVGTLPAWATSTTLGNSIISQSGSVATVTGTLALTGTSLSIAGETINSGTGSPEGAVTASPGSLYMQDDGAVWRKASGSGNTGWVGFALSGTGTTDTLTKWTSASGLGNSLVSESGTTVTVGGLLATVVSNTATASVSQVAILRHALSSGTPANGIGARLRFDGLRLDGEDTPAAYVDGIVTDVINESGALVINTRTVGVDAERLRITGNDVLPGSGYQTNLGALSKKYLTLHAAELWVETLVAQNTIATIGGRVLVAPTNLLSADLAAAATSITVKYNNLANGDRVYMEANSKVEFMAITSAPGGSAGAYTYTVTRNLDGSGANDWFAGDAILNTGQTGNGFIDIYSVRGIKAGTEIGPTIVGNVRLSSTYNDWAPRWAIGNLDGLPYGVSAYGVAIGNSAAANIVIDDTNGIRIRNGTTTKIQFSTAGVATIGSWTISTDRLESVGAGGRFITIVTDGGITMSDAVSNNIGMAIGSTGTDLAFFAGGVTPASSPFRVRYDGHVTMTSGDVAGAIVAGSITSSHIAAGTIVAGNIAAGTITGDRLVAGTITATQIAAATITADRLSVSTLSAISADLGTINAGTVNGVTLNGITINAGPSNNVTLDASGLSMPDGTSVSGYRIHLGDSEIWGGTGAAGIKTSGGFFSNGNLGCGGDFFSTGVMSCGNLAGGGDRALRVTNGGVIYAA